MIKANYCYVAHRGMHSRSQNIPENSIGAFKLAMQNRFAIHFEVRLTFDNEAIVFADDNFNRMCSLNMNVIDCPSEEASRLMLNSTEYRIPTLKQALDTIGGEVPILIEIIQDRDDLIGILEEKVVRELEDYKGVFAIESSNPLVVLWFKNHYPNVFRGQIINSEINESAGLLQKVLQKTQAINFVSSPNFISYNIDALTEKYAEDCHRKNIAILGHTATNEEQLKKSKKLCDGTVFEEIAVE